MVCSREAQIKRFLFICWGFFSQLESCVQIDVQQACSSNKSECPDCKNSKVVFNKVHQLWSQQIHGTIFISQLIIPHYLLSIITINLKKLNNLSSFESEWQIQVELRLCYELSVHIFVKMDRKDYTPTKGSHLLNASSIYGATARQASKFAGEMSLAREYEALKLQAKQLEIVNRQLAAQAEKLRYQKSMNENKLLQKATFEEEAMIQFQKEKNHQMDLMKVKNQEALATLRRQFENKIEEMQSEIKSRELYGQQLADKFTVLESKVQQSRMGLQHLELELTKHRENNSNLTEQVTREQFANKKLEMLAEELQRQRNQMEDQIHVLLDIEADKTNTITSLQIQYQQSEDSIANLNSKLAMLTENFAALQQHIAIMKDRLLNAEMRGEEVQKQLQATHKEITDREQLYSQQKERQLRIRDEIERHKQRQAERLAEIRHLIGENQRIYSDLNGIRFRLYDVSIEQGIEV